MAKKSTTAKSVKPTSGNGPEEKKEVRVKVALSPDEYELLKAAASGCGMSTGKFARTVILDNLETSLKQAQANISEQLRKLKKRG